MCATQKRRSAKRAEQRPALTQGTLTSSLQTTQLTLLFVFMLKGEKYFPGSWKWSFSINLPFACCFTKIQSDTKQTPEFHTKEDGKIHPSGLGTAASRQRSKGLFHQGTCQHPPQLYPRAHTKKAASHRPPQIFEQSPKECFKNFWTSK